MGTTTKRVLRGAAAVAGALALGTAFAGTASASPLGGLGGDDNDGSNEGPADFANFGSNNYHGDNDYGDDSSMFGDGDSTPGFHNDLMNFDPPKLETQ